ncbi:MAG: hypothetical protein ACYC46_07675 [Acidobacteriaceae bacterium]
MPTARTSTWQNRWPLLLIPFTALLAIAPLLLQGYSCGHDFDFHTLNWIEVAAQWHQGILYPHWATTAAYGAGEPRFVFYPPLSWMLGALLGLVFPWTTTPILYTFLILTGCGCSMYRLAREWVPQNIALLAAAMYAVNPYMLFTAYERTAYAELLAAVWIPLLLLAILRKKPTISGIAIPIALLWLSNAPGAVMGCYALAVLACIRLLALWRNFSNAAAAVRFAATSLSGVLLGHGLAAFYIVPAAYERRWVHIEMAILPEMSIQDNFLFGHTSDPLHNEVLSTASWIAILLITITLIAAFFAYLHLRQKRSGTASTDTPILASDAALPLMLLALCIAFFLTPPSLFLWMHAPEMRFLQFTWRWLAVLGAVMAVLLAFALRPLQQWSKLLFTLSVLLPVLIVPTAYSVFQQECDPGDLIPAQLQAFHADQGVEPTDEYTPRTVDNEVLKPDLPQFWLGDEPDAAPPHMPKEARIRTIGQRTAEHWQFSVPAPHPAFLILRLRAYPAWQVRVNGILQSQLSERSDGLITIPLADTAVSVDIRYSATPDRRIGRILSILALLVWLTLAIIARRHPTHL